MIRTQKRHMTTTIDPKDLGIIPIFLGLAAVKLFGERRIYQFDIKVATGIHQMKVQ